jgi:microcystin degradation protein MlrC
MGPLCRTIVDCDTPGPAAADLSTLPYRRIPESLRAGLNRP